MESPVKVAKDRAPYDVERVRADFPILGRRVYDRPLVYLDNAASAQKPNQVIEAELSVYREEYANIHRGPHFLSELTTARFEEARNKVCAFLKAKHPREIIFTRNATEAINLVAASYGRRFLEAGDEIILSELEHHANIVPWQMLRAEKGIVIKVAPITDEGEFQLDEFAKLLGPKTRLVSISHMSNALGTILPVHEIVRMAHACGAKALIDGAQAVTHLDVDMQELDCDFYVFSGHKLYGPSGIGVLYGREELLDAMPPYQGGGDMISQVTWKESLWAPLPNKFEAGTPAIAQAIGLGAAIDYLGALGMGKIAEHEADLLAYATKAVLAIPGLSIFGTAPVKASVLSFLLEGVHPHDIGTILDRSGVAIRAGHHCAQPLMDRMGVTATARASFALYNTRAEIDALIKALERVLEIFKA
jgi:cysteine desulfurase/selenocysteine lyase